MTPTLDEMKLLVAAMVPEHITTYALCAPEWRFEWNDTFKLVTDREWLEVCRLAEGTFAADDVMAGKYWLALYDVTATTRWPYDATAEQRIEALCRVRHPEKFQPEK